VTSNARYLFKCLWLGACGHVESCPEFRYIRCSRIADTALKRIVNLQVALKPQDLLVALKLALSGQKTAPYADLAESLGMSASEVHASVGRLKQARLVVVIDDQQRIVTASLREFVLHGARYAFPATTGSQTAGLPTGYAVAPLATQFVQSSDLPPVWPYAKGTRRGIALYPLYPSVPVAALNDTALYECLSLFDALRVGRARERQLAQRMLGERLS
jgi:hypothetical protein